MKGRRAMGTVKLLKREWVKVGVRWPIRREPLTGEFGGEGFELNESKGGEERGPRGCEEEISEGKRFFGKSTGKAEKERRI